MVSGRPPGFVRLYEEDSAAFPYGGPLNLKSNETLALAEDFTLVVVTKPKRISSRRLYRQSLVILGVSIMLLLITLVLLWTPLLGL